MTFSIICNDRRFSLAVVLGVATCLGLYVARPGAVSAAKKAPPFYLGADISTLASVEARGGVYMDEGKPGDGLAIFMKHGWTCMRVRIWVDPSGGATGLEYTTKLAKRIKDAGATLMLDLHYSDTWADPKHQVKPAAWAKLDFDGLEKKTESYTADVMRTLKAAGALPDFVQIGNEITGGALWPDAQVKVIPISTVHVLYGPDRVAAYQPPEPYDDVKQWDHLARIVKAGIRGVRSVAKPADHVRTIIHIDSGGDWPVTKWYFDHATQAKVDFDIIGQSYYPDVHGSIENLRDCLRETARRYHKDIMVVETAYDTNDNRTRTPAAAKNMIWPRSPEGQKQFLTDLIKTVKATPDGRGIGVNYWHPEGTYVPGATGGRGPDSRSLFDAKGNALPAMSVLK